MNQKLVEFIRTQTLLGKTPKEISDVLITQGGWTHEEVQSAFTEAQAGSREHMQPMVGESITPAPAQVRPIQTSPVLTTTNQERPRKKGLRMRTTILLLIAFLLLAAGLAYAYLVYLPNRNQPSLGDTLSVVIAHSTALTRASYAGSIHATGTFSYIGNEGATASSTDALTNKVKGSFNVRVPFTFSYIRTGSSTDWEAEISPLGSFSMPPLSISASATSSFIFASSTLYARLDDISEMMIPFDFSQIKHRWIKIPVTQASSSALHLENAGTLYASSSEAYKRALTRALSEQAIKVVDTLPGSILGGERTYHYRFQVDVGTFSTILSEELRAVLPDDESITPEELDRDLATLPPLWGDLWIDRDSLTLRRISLSYHISTTSPMSSDFVTEFDTSSTFVLERVATISSTITAPETSLTPNELTSIIQFNSYFSHLPDTSSSTETTARTLWTARDTLLKNYPALATTSRLWRRYPANACKLLGTSTACRVGPASAIGNTFVLWANLPTKRILCVDSSTMVLLSKSLKTTEYRCPPAVTL